MQQIKLERCAAPWLFGTLIALALSSCASQRAKTASTPIPQEAPKVAAVPAPAPEPVPAPAPKADSMKTLPVVKLWGVVQSVSLDGKLVIKDKHGRTHAILVTDVAQITKGGDDKTVALADIKTGDHVKLKVSGDTAVSVHISVLASKFSQVAKAQ